MNHSKSLSFFIVLAIASAAAVAQDKPATAATPAAAASKPMDCGPGARRHDHGADRNLPISAAKGCPPQRAASANKPLHDHAKVHK